MGAMVVTKDVTPDLFMDAVARRSRPPSARASLKYGWRWRTLSPSRRRRTWKGRLEKGSNASRQHPWTDRIRSKPRASSERACLLV